MPINESTLMESLPAVQDPELGAMLADLAASPNIYHPSKFWVYYLSKNVDEIEKHGIGNFKQTVNQNYFNWIGSPTDEHATAITDSINSLAKRITLRLAAWSEDTSPNHAGLNEHEWIQYKEYVALLWEFTRKYDKLRLLKQTDEPVLGNPLSFTYRGRRISQDICNSTLEINALAEGLGPAIAKANIVEIGGGYGRIADILLGRYPDVQITMVDIPPGLYLCQWYLCNLYPNRQIFRYRPFAKFTDVKDEFERASIRFLLPHQLRLIPDGAFTAMINVSSLHEMRPDQIDHWFSEIDRLVKGYFYTKQWIKSVNDYDKIVVERQSYPVRPNWKELYNRQCAVQKSFFEALYMIS